MNINEKISFIGCGNMSSAIVKGLINQGLSPLQIMVSNRSEGKLNEIKPITNIHTTTNNIKAVNFSNVIILAVKPQVLPQICLQLKDTDLSKKLIISIIAGATTSTIANGLNQKLAIVRAMPNTPSMISEGATGLFGNEQCNQNQLDTTSKIFESVGKIAWVKKESLINTITAISGSSPAYFYLLMQAMLDQAILLGLDESDARKLISQSMLGTAKLAQCNASTPLDDLRQAVTSPGGTTFEAIQSFEQSDFSGIVKKAVDAAYNKGVSLGEQS